MVRLFTVLFSPDAQLIQYVHQRSAPAAQAVLHPGRDLPILSAGYDSVSLEFLKGRGEHCVGDAGDFPYKIVVPLRSVGAERAYYSQQALLIQISEAFFLLYGYLRLTLSGGMTHLLFRFLPCLPKWPLVLYSDRSE